MAIINPYKKTVWFDHIVDPTNGQVIQEGTRFNAERANNIEDGVYDLYERDLIQEREIKRLQVQLDLIGRAPGNSGAFVDTLDGYTNKMTYQTAKADVTEAVTAGATTLKVDNVEGFVALTQVTIYDDVSHEDVLITAVNADSIEVQALTNSYKRGAVLSRANVVVDTTYKLMLNGSWGTFTVSASEVV